MTYRVEVIDSFARDPILIARLDGFPSQLNGYREGAKRVPVLIVRVGTGHYHLLEDGGDDAWQKLKKASEWDSEFRERLTAESLFLEAPLANGKRFGSFHELTRPDNSYCAIVTGSAPFDLTTVKNAPTLARAEWYEISELTRPAHSFTSFVPGLGIVGYSYVHHGTVAEASLQLIEYKAPPKK